MFRIRISIQHKLHWKISI